MVEKKAHLVTPFTSQGSMQEGTHQCQGGVVQDGLAGLVDEFRGTREAHSGDLPSDVLRGDRDDMGLDGQRALGDVLA